MQGWSFSDVMFVTKHSMANAVATVSKQLEDVYEAVAVSTVGQAFPDFNPFKIHSILCLAHCFLGSHLCSLQDGI